MLQHPLQHIYKRCQISSDSSVDKHFLQFSGKCRDCLAIVTGRVNKKPDDEPLTINNKMDNIDILHQHTSKRSVNGEKRREVDIQLF